MKKVFCFLGILGFALSCTMIKPNAAIFNIQQVERGESGGGGVLYANDLVVGATYTRYDFQPYLSGDNVPNGPRFGQLKETIDMKNQKEVYADKMTYHAGTWLAGSDAYDKFDTYRYSVWNMNTVCNLPYQTSDVNFYRKNDKINVKWAKTESDSYETSVQHTLTGSISFGINASASFFDFLKVGISEQKEIESSVSHTFTKKHEITNTNEVSRELVINDSGYYASQRRATYKMYIVLSFEIPYEMTMTHAYEGWWYREWYSYKKIEGKYKYLGYKVYYEFINDLGNCFVRYTTNKDGVLVFNDSDMRSSGDLNTVYM